jgi:hypothetical protein
VHPALAGLVLPLTPRSRVVVVNTPHNPTGVIYSRERLAQLAALLERKSVEFGRRLFILSDEPYRRIRLDGAAFTSPAEVYPWTLIDYSYGKILLAPGLRLGYLAICPDMPGRERSELQRMIKFAHGIATGADIARAMKAGAQGVMMGTRFLASEDSLAHPVYKQALVEATAEQMVYTNCFDIGWPYAMSRVLRNSTFEMWEVAGNTAAPDRPGEGDIIFRCGNDSLVRYCDTSPALEAEGDLLAGCLHAGMGCYRHHQCAPRRPSGQRKPSAG